MDLAAGSLTDAAPARAARVGIGTISIIVPCWRDDAVAGPVAARWLAHDAVREVIVAAAGTDKGDEEAMGSGMSPDRLRVVRCPRHGRGHQMNHAARHATGEILLFHHARHRVDRRPLREFAGRGG